MTVLQREHRLPCTTNLGLYLVHYRVGVCGCSSPQSLVDPIGFGNITSSPSPSAVSPGFANISLCFDGAYIMHARSLRFSSAVLKSLMALRH